MEFTTELLGPALEILGVGMGGIFIAMAIIYLASLLLHKTFPGTNGEKEENSES